MAERNETRQERKEKKERERQEREKQERERKERERLEKQEKERKKKEEKEMKRRERNTSSAGDISPSHHQPSPTIDARQIPPDSQWVMPGSDTASPTGTTTSPTGTGRLGPIKAVHSQAMVMVKQPHDSYPVTDNRQPACTTINTTNTTGITVTTTTAGTSTTDHVKVTNDDMKQIQAIKKSPLVAMKTPTDNTPMRKFKHNNDEPTHAGANNITVPSGSVTTRPVTGPIGSLHPPLDDDTASQQSLSNSINTRLAIAEIERDEYKKEMEKRERELKQRQEEIVQLRVKMRKLQSNSPQTHPQSSHLIDEREQKMKKELAAKEREVNELRRETGTLAREKEDLKREKDKVAADNVAAKEKEMEEKLTAKEEEMINLKQKIADQERESKEALVFHIERSKSLEEKVKLLKVDNQHLKTQLNVVFTDKKKVKQNQNEKKEAELMPELVKVREEKEMEINRRNAIIKHLQGYLDKFNNETVPNLERKLEDKEREQKNLLEMIEDLKRQNHKVATQAVEGVAWKEREMEELKKRLEEMEGEREENEAKLRETIDNLQHQLNEAIKVVPVEDGASANSSLTDEEKSKIILDMKEKEIKELTEKIAMLERGNDDHAAIVAQLAEEHVNEKERLLTTINDLSNIIKQLDGPVGGEMVKKLTQQYLLVEEKEQTIATLNNTINELRQRIVKVVKQNNEAIQNVNEKQLVIDQKEVELKELTEELQIVKVQLQEYEDGFNSERKDRERMSSELDEKRSQVLALQQSLHDETHKTKELEAKYHSLQDIVQEQKNELSMKDEAAKDWEEEKLILTTQANSYARQGDKLKKSLSELRDKCKSLEDQLMKKTEIENEELKSELNLVSAINQKTTKVTEIEQQKINLEEAMKMEQAEKARLQQFIAQEQAKAEDEMTKLRNANKILTEKLQATEAACKYQNQSHHYGPNPSRSPLIDKNQRTSYPYHHNEQYSYSQDIPPPQMNLQQMQQYSRHALQQREQQQQQQQLGELYRVRGEEMRRRDEDLRQLQEEQEEKRAIADRELAELEELKRELKRRELERKPFLSHYQYSSRNEEMVSPVIAEVQEEDDDSSLPYDPNLVCPKCGKQYRIGQIQYLRQHLEGLCHPDTEDVIAKGNLTEEIAFYAEEVRRMSRQPNTEEVMREDDDSSLPYDPNLVCPKCGKLYRKGQIQYLRRHMKEFCP